MIAVADGPWIVCANHQLARRAGLDLHIVFVDEADLHAGARLAASPGRTGLGAAEQGHGNLGHVELGIDVDAEPLGEPWARLVIGGDQHRPQGVAPVVGRWRLAEEEVGHGAQKARGGDFVAAHDVPEVLGAEGLGQNHRAGVDQGPQDPIDSAHMVHGQGRQVAIAGADVPEFQRGRVAVPIARQHALGRPGGSGRVDHHLGVPRGDRRFGRDQAGRVRIEPVAGDQLYPRNRRPLAADDRHLTKPGSTDLA